MVKKVRRKFKFDFYSVDSFIMKYWVLILVGILLVVMWQVKSFLPFMIRPFTYVTNELLEGESYSPSFALSITGRSGVCFGMAGDEYIGCGGVIAKGNTASVFSKPDGSRVWATYTNSNLDYSSWMGRWGCGGLECDS